jgi:FkbM family methyltransferase
VLLQTLASWTSGLLGRDSAVVKRLRAFYESALDVSTGGRGFLRTVNGEERFYVHPRYRRYIPDSYEPRVCDFLRARVRPGAICLNAGAHVGLYALCLAEWSKPDGRVLAFEPNPWARALLDSHVVRNAFAERIEVIPQALGDASGEMTFYAAGLEGFSRLGSPNPETGTPHTAVTVSVTTVDLVCAAKGLVPDWLVLDVEGYEVAVLAGARRTIREATDLRIIVELHPQLWASSGSSRAALEVLLAELHMRAVPLTGQLDPLGEKGVVRLELR